jgi:hypothetical protein
MDERTLQCACKADLTIEMAAVLYVESLRVMTALEAGCVDQAPACEPLARGMLTCGEAAVLIPAVARLVLMMRPELTDPEVLEDAVRSALAESAAGAAN